MAEQKATQKIEREYVIPLRRAWINVPAYKRSRKAVLTIKKFVAKHMKVKDRNLDNVKLDVYLNNDIWFKGRSKPPSKVKVKVIKEGDVVLVKYAETPQYVKFLKLKHAKIHKKLDEKKAEIKEEKKEEHKPETKTEEQKVDEKEKGRAVEQQNIKQAEQQVTAQKHTTKSKEEHIHRMALKK